MGRRNREELDEDVLEDAKRDDVIGGSEWGDEFSDGVKENKWEKLGEAMVAR